MHKMGQQAFRRLLIRNIALPLILGLVSCGVFLGMIAQLVNQTANVDLANKIIADANLTTKLFSDAETGLRGYAITGLPSFLEPYNYASSRIPVELDNLHQMVDENAIQKNRLNSIAEKYRRWLDYAESVRLAKIEKRDTAIIISSGQGKTHMDQIRETFNQFIAAEESNRETRTHTTNESINYLLTIVILLSVISSTAIAYSGRKQLLALSKSYEDILQSSFERNEALQKQQWLKTGQTDLAEKIMNEQKIDSLGATVIASVAQYVQADLGAFYIARENGEIFERVATYAYQASTDGKASFKLKEGIIGQAAADKKLTELKGIPKDYVKVSSALGDTPPSHLIVVPVINEGVTTAVLELGFIHHPDKRTLEFLHQVTENISIAIKSVQFREQREIFLKEIQNQAEELQTQQEELRVSNEELEEQARILKETQLRLEAQHAELEQTNSHLEEQAQTLGIQKNLLDQRNEALVEAQHALERKAEELQRASQYKTEFLANMSHELRTPLNSSLILAKLLSDNKDKNLTPTQVEFAAQIVNSGNDLLNLINDILDLSKVEAGKLDIHPEEFSVKRLVEHLEKEFAPLARNKNLTLSTEIKSDTPKMIYTDRLRIEQVLKNLLSNAIKFTSQGSVKIVISKTNPQGHGNNQDTSEWLRFDVIDTGIGIKKEQHEIIFEAFRQADGTTNRKFGGTGLGLSISKDLVRLLGGFIVVDSQPGRGSTFSLIMPTQYDEARVEQQLDNTPVSYVPSSIPHSEENMSGLADIKPKLPHKTFIEDDREKLIAQERCVLIVEDDETFAKILVDLAHEHKFKCLVTETAEEALDFAIKYQPVAVLLDIKLSDQSGLFVLDQLKQNPKTRHILVHVISGHDYAQQALFMGAIGYMMKPVKRETLDEAFAKIEGKLHQDIRKILIVEDNDIQRKAIQKLIEDTHIETLTVESGSKALDALEKYSFDCMIMDLNLPDMSGFQLLEKMSQFQNGSYPPVIVYTGRALTSNEEAELAKYSQSVIIKGAKSPERLLDEVTLFLHRVESQMNPQQKSLLENLRNREKIFESKTIMIVDDDMRNTFALTAALESKGGRIVIAKNGQECLQKLEAEPHVDIILMDIMMPIMDGYQAMREIRKNPKFKKVSIIALTAKAMKDDRELCLQAGANDYLAKPVDIDKLLSLMRIWLSANRGV